MRSINTIALCDVQKIFRIYVKKYGNFGLYSNKTIQKKSNFIEESEKFAVASLKQWFISIFNYVKRKGVLISISRVKFDFFFLWQWMKNLKCS